MSEVAGGTDIDDDQGGGRGVHKNDDQRKQKERFGFRCGCLCTENFRKAKTVVLFPFTKAKKQIFHRRNKRDSLCSSAPAPAPAANANGRFSGNTVKGFCFCFRQPNTLDSPCDSHRSDPNDPSFSGEMLKFLIDKNDFYSKECNPHLD